MHVGPQVVDPQVLGPGLLLGWAAVEKEDVGFHPSCVKEARWKSQKRVAVELLQQVPADRLAGPAFEEDVVRDDDSAAAVDLQQRLDVLDEVELLVLRRRPEILPLVGMVFLLQLALFVDDGDGALLAEGRIGEDHAVPLAGVAGEAVDP